MAQQSDKHMGKNVSKFNVSGDVKVSVTMQKICLTFFLPTKYISMFTYFTNFSFKDSAEEVGC